MLSKITGIFLTRGLSTFGPLLITFFFTHYYDLEMLGHYVIFWSYALLVSGICSFGLPKSLLKFLPSSKDKSEFFRFLNTSVFLCSVFLFLCFLVTTSLFSTALDPLMFIVAVSLVAIRICNSVLKTEERFYIANFLEGGGIQIILFTMLVTNYYTNFGLRWESVIVALYSIILTILSAHYIRMNLLKGFSVVYDKAVVQELLNHSKFIFVGNLSGLMNNSIVFLILGQFLPVAHVGFARIVTQMGTLINFPLVAINSYFPVLISKAHLRGDYGLRDSYCKASSSISIILSVIVSIILLFVANFEIFEPLLLIDGLNVWLLLLIAALAFLINSLTGSIGYFMQLTDHAKFYSFALLFLYTFSLVILTFQIQFYGLMGFAFYLFFINFVLNIVLVSFVRLKNGFYHLPYFRYSDFRRIINS